MINATNWSSTWELRRKIPFNNWFTWDIILPFCMKNIWITRNHNLFNHKDNPIPVENTIVEATKYTLTSKTFTPTTNPTNIIYIK